MTSVRKVRASEVLPTDTVRVNGHVVVITRQMRFAVQRTLAHARWHPIVVWTGYPGAGKTTAARWLASTFTGDTQGDPAGSARHALILELGGSTVVGNGADKRLMRALFEEVAGQISEATYRRSTADSLAAMLVEDLRAFGTQLLILDEAGRLSDVALDGITLLRNKAEAVGVPLSIVLVGMGDLPGRVERIPQLRRRVVDTILFAQSELADVRNMLLAWFPKEVERLGVDLNDAELLQAIADVTQSLPGSILPLMTKVFAFAVGEERAISPEFVRRAAQAGTRDRAQAFEMRKNEYRPPEHRNATSTNSQSRPKKLAASR
jgi:type II secretory pathway predicted ATPase ExeA